MDLPAYFTDIIFCIDCSPSMSSYLFQVKTMVRAFWRDFYKARTRYRPGRQLIFRAKIIGFNTLYDGDTQESDYYLLPASIDAFEEYLHDLGHQCLSKERVFQPNNGLKALKHSIISHTEEDNKTRENYESRDYRQCRAIVVFSDQASFGKQDPDEQKILDSVSDELDELNALWNQINSLKILFILAPYIKGIGWSKITDGQWKYEMHYPSPAGTGMDEITWKEMAECDFEGL